jgi:hypothetical protein
MPYIAPINRNQVDPAIDELVRILGENRTPDELLAVAGVMNYAISRLITEVSGDISYGKCCILTGVLQNVSQEYYRRAAAPYEDRKATENGDLDGYK